MVPGSQLLAVVDCAGDYMPNVVLTIENGTGGTWSPGGVRCRVKTSDGATHFASGVHLWPVAPGQSAMVQVLLPVQTFVSTKSVTDIAYVEFTGAVHDVGGHAEYGKKSMMVYGLAVVPEKPQRATKTSDL